MFLPIILLALAAEVSEAPPRLPTVATVERIPLPQSAASVILSLDAFGKRIDLRPTRDSKGLASKIAAAGSRLCPRTQPDRDGVILQCVTRRLDAAFIHEKSGLFLELYELRGVPWRGDENRIEISYDPVTFQLGHECPGNTPVARGECTYDAGQYTVAAVEFRRALSEDGRHLAAMRLGDISLRNKDPVTAAAWYQAASRAGPFGRMAAARLCELSGSCLGKRRRMVFDASLLPEPLHTEMLLRAARLSAFLDEIPQAMIGLRKVIEAGHGGCEGSTLLVCRQLLLKVLQGPDKDGAVEALDTYLALPGRMQGPLAIALMYAAAGKAAALGAPIFAGNLLAASSQVVEASHKELLGDFLLRTAELYLEGFEHTRARVVGEYAETRLGRAKMTGPRWNVVLNEMQSDDEAARAVVRANVATGEVTRDLALAYTALARSTSVRLSAEEADEGLPAEEP